jgi:hypothetical protein
MLAMLNKRIEVIATCLIGFPFQIQQPRPQLLVTRIIFDPYSSDNKRFQTSSAVLDEPETVVDEVWIATSWAVVEVWQDLPSQFR